jgi:PRTRC genetic system protein E
MFQELMPLLAQRILLLTLSRVSDEQISVNIIPKTLKSDPRDENAALTTPLSVTGTPKELDEQLPRQLVEFVETHLGLSSTLKTVKEQMEAAAKAAREAAKKVGDRLPCSPWMNSTIVHALVSSRHSMIDFPPASITATETVA